MFGKTLPDMNNLSLSKHIFCRRCKDIACGQSVLLMAGDSLLFGDCRSVSHLESGQTIWTDDDIHSLLVKTTYISRMEINDGNCNEMDGCCRSASHLESGQTIWTDDDIHSLLVKTTFIKDGNCNEMDGCCRSVTHLESGQIIWTDDDIHSLLVKL